MKMEQRKTYGVAKSGQDLLRSEPEFRNSDA